MFLPVQKKLPIHRSRKMFDELENQQKLVVTKKVVVTSRVSRNFRLRTWT